MYVEVDLKEKSIEVVVGEPELPKLLNNKLRLKKDGILYIYDDDVEYGSRYKFELWKENGTFKMKISEEGADGVFYEYGVVKFNDVKELEIVDNILWKKCREPHWMKDLDWKILERYVEVRRNAICGVINYVKISKIGRRLVSIGVKLAIF